jgi:hypothetical protein
VVKGDAWESTLLGHLQYEALAYEQEYTFLPAGETTIGTSHSWEQ